MALAKPLTDKEVAQLSVLSMITALMLLPQIITAVLWLTQML